MSVEHDCFDSEIQNVGIFCVSAKNYENKRCLYTQRVVIGPMFYVFYFNILTIAIDIFSILLPSPLHSEVTDRECIQASLKRMPDFDRQRLSNFLEELVVNHQFGYTIFGDKPASFAGYFFDLPREVSFLKRSYLILQRGKHVWQKYGSTFQLKNFIFKFQTDYDKGWTCIYLINKKNFSIIVNEHIDLFRQILGQNVTDQSLLEEISKDDTKIEDILIHNEALKGIILGYGIKNSFLFQRREEIIHILHKSFSLPMSTPEIANSLSKTDLMIINSDETREQTLDHHIDFTTLVNEYLNIQNIFDNSLRDTQYLSYFRLPVFCADIDDPETKNLLEKYIETRRVLVQAYSHGDFLEVTLCKMVETD